jgi:hypothetical protein
MSDSDSELQTVELSPQERGASFSLSNETYRALACTFLSLHADLMTIRRLGKDLPGAVVDCYCGDCLLTICVAAKAQAISLHVCETLDSPESSCVLSVEDSREGWQRIRHMMRTVLGGRQ